MITPVSLISHSKYDLFKVKNNNSKNNDKIKQNEISFPVENGFSNPFSIGSSIYFSGYLYKKPQTDFDTTIEENYFQLPQVKLKDGRMYQLPPDENQIKAAKELYDGNSLLYSVSTGSGKTAVAHWVITKNLKENKKSIFTVPTKALANDKYDEFCEIYGKEKTGILTGDTKINPSAPVVIMTLEIYEKQLASGILNSKNTGTVIYDETHYISDNERGRAWENSIMESSNRNIQMLFLTATIGNAEAFRSWIESLNSSMTVNKIEVSPSERFVPQLYYTYTDGEFMPLIDGVINLDENFSKRQNRGLETLVRLKEDKDIDYKVSKEDLEAVLSELKEKTKQAGFSTDFLTLDELKTILENNYKFLSKDETEAISQLLLKPENKTVKHFHKPHQESNYPELVYQMKENDMLPAIIYRLSKRNCEDTADDIVFHDIEGDLTTEEEKIQIERIIRKYQEENKYLGICPEAEKARLIKGVGVHHSAKAPECKALVEELFRKKLLKVVVATSTLGVGIDMPAKSTVITDMTYKDIDPVTQETNYKPITANEFWQMAGRAGRRGQDNTGNIIIYNPRTYITDSKKKTKKRRIDEEALIQKYLTAKPDKLISSYKPSLPALAQYYMKNSEVDGLRDLIKKSFKVYLSKNTKTEISNLEKQFMECNKILLKENYIHKRRKSITVTPKGEILALSKSSNPLMLSSLLYDKDLKNVSVEQLCQIAGYIAGSENTKEKDETPEFSKMLTDRISLLNKAFGIYKKGNSIDYEREYIDAKRIFKNKEISILQHTEDVNFDFDGRVFSNEYSGYVAYLWAILNQNNKNSIANFNRIIKFSLREDEETLKNIFNTKATEGDNYKIIAQTISILKQIKYICDYALSRKDNFQDTDYWRNIQAKSVQAIELMSKPPVKEAVDA